MKKLLSLASLICACALFLVSCASPIDGVKQMAEITNSLCPMQQGENVTVTKVELDGTTLTYYCEYDDENVDIESNADACRQAIVDELKSDADVTNLFKSANVTVVYKYTATNSGASISLSVSPDEL